MPIDTSTIDDPTALEIIEALQRRVGEAEAALAVSHAEQRELEQQLQHKRFELSRLQHKLDDLLQRLHGPRSERLNEAQLLLFGIMAAMDAQADDGKAAHGRIRPRRDDTHTDARNKRTGGGRRPLPEHLPVHTQTLEPSADEIAGMVKIREEVTDQLDVVPRCFFIRRTVRPVYADPRPADGVPRPPVIAPLPMQVLPQASVAAGFIADVVVRKYADHVPLYRQAVIDARSGVTISRQARLRYVEHAALLMLAIRDQLKRKALDSQHRYLQVDETFVKLLDPDRRGKAVTAYMWGYLAPHEKALVVEFATSRSSDTLEAFVPPDWRGHLQSDGAGMYTHVLAQRPGVEHLCCMVHLRRYVVASLKARDPEAVGLYLDLQALFQLERDASALQLDHTARGMWRHGKARPILKRLQKRFHDLAKDPQLKHRHALKKAVQYANNRWSAFVVYAKLGHGHLSISNNDVERCFRPLKTGLRNYSFIGHPDAGWQSAVLYSVIGSCLLNEVNPHGYIRWALEKLAAGTTATTASGLLPQDYAQLPEAERLAIERCQPTFDLGEDDVAGVLAPRNG